MIPRMHVKINQLIYMRRNFFWVSFLFFLSLFILPSFRPIFAGQITILSGDGTSLTGDQSITVTASASGFPSGQSLFIKGVFHKDGSTNYFGYTQNAGDWTGNSESKTNQRQVAVDSWNGSLTAKSNYGDSGFTGDGSYKFKIGYYLSAADDVTWSTNEINVTLVGPTPTPSPTPSLTPTPSSTPQPTVTMTPTLTPTTKPTKTPYPTMTAEPTPTDLPVTPTTEDITPQPTDTPMPTEVKAATQVNQKVVITLAFVGVGSGILAILTLVTAIQNARKNKEDDVPPQDR